MQSTHRHGQGLIPFNTSVLVPAEALKAMEKVASHINEMQKIYEDYGAVFDQLVAEQTGHDKEVDTHFRVRFLMTKNSLKLVTLSLTQHLLKETLIED